MQVSSIFRLVFLIFGPDSLPLNQLSRYPGTIASSGLTSLGSDKMMSEHAGSLLEDPINLESITQWSDSLMR